MFTDINQTVHAHHTGQNGYMEAKGTAKFNDLDAAGTIPCLLNRVDNFQITAVGPVATDEALYLDEAANFAAGMVTPVGGVLNVGRTGAAKTNDLIVAFRYTGY